MRVDQLHPAEIATCVTLVCNAFAKDHRRIRRYWLIMNVFAFLYLPVPTFIKRSYEGLANDQAVKRNLITHMLSATQKGASGQAFTLDDYFTKDSPIITLKKDWLSRISIEQL
jgi:hypothetical protein